MSRDQRPGRARIVVAEARLPPALPTASAASPDAPVAAVPAGIGAAAILPLAVLFLLASLGVGLFVAALPWLG